MNKIMYYRQLKGQKFDKLLVVKEIKERDKWGNVQWYCLCDCGKYTTATSGALNSGRKKSCGCLKNEKVRELNLSHNHRRF